MSATLEAGPLAAFLGGCPQIAVEGRQHALDIEYRPGESIATSAAALLREGSGSVLCFLAGASDINRALPDVRAAAGAGVEVLPLHGSLPAEDQDRALVARGGRRVILATNIAETSLTVPDVTAVVDTGWQKVARYDPDRGIDSLELERIPGDAADQRAGRAGRLGPGRVRRLWDRADRLRAHRQPEIHRVDLSDSVLDILAWGGNPSTFDWFDAPPADRIDAALVLLRQLGAVRDGKVTALGARMKRMPLHPRLARILLEAGGRRDVALACASLSERHATPSHPATTSSDLLSAVSDDRAVPAHVREVARRLGEMASETPPPDRAGGDASFLRAVFAGYPDRVARRRDAGSTRFLLTSGHGAVLGRESGVRDASFLVAVDVHAGRRGEGAEATIRIASAIDPEWLEPTDVRLEHSIESGRVRAVERTYYGAIPIGERPGSPDPGEAEQLLADAYAARGLTAADEQLVRRLRFADLTVDVPSLLRRAAAGRRGLAEIDLRGALDGAVARDLERHAPQTIAVPSGRTASLIYHEDGTVVAAVKLQELFGLAESPRLGPRKEPIVFELLAPNGRAVQTTRDLRSFWNSTYQEVRKELRGRYPRHPWPEDPWTAPATARAKPRR
jgi:ATP-dependent helicase HrpB